MVADYNPVWYEAYLKQDLQTPHGLIKAGLTVYFTPNIGMDWFTVYDGNKKFVNPLHRDKMQDFLGVDPGAKSRWRKDRYPRITDQRYMKAFVHYQADQAEHKEAEHGRT